MQNHCGPYFHVNVFFYSDLYLLDFFQHVIACDWAQLLKTGDCNTGQIDSGAEETSKSVYIVAGYL